MKACLFDIDGTLVATGGAGQLAFAETFADLFGVPEINGRVAFAGRSDRAIAMELFSLHGIPATEESWTRFLAGYTERLDRCLVACAGRVLPGVVELVSALEQRGDVLIGLITGNVRQGAEKKLRHYGLWDRFAFGGFGDHHTERADIARAAVREARARFGGPPVVNPTVMVIGDTPADIHCAQAVGAIAVAVPTGHSTAADLTPHNPHLVVESLRDQGPILACFDR